MSKRLPFQRIPRSRGVTIIELAAAMSVTSLVAVLAVTLFISSEKSSGAMLAQARVDAAARETSAMIQQDVNSADSVSVEGARLVLHYSGAGKRGRATYSNSVGGWVRERSGQAPGRTWLREEVRSLTFAREGRGVRTTIVCRSGFQTRRRPQPKEVELVTFAAPRNGGR